MEIGSVVVWPKKRSTNLVNNTIEGAKVRVSTRIYCKFKDSISEIWGFRVGISEFRDLGLEISKFFSIFWGFRFEDLKMGTLSLKVRIGALASQFRNSRFII